MTPLLLAAGLVIPPAPAPIPAMPEPAPQSPTSGSPTWRGADRVSVEGSVKGTRRPLDLQSFEGQLRFRELCEEHADPTATCDPAQMVLPDPAAIAQVFRWQDVADVSFRFVAPVDQQVHGSVEVFEPWPGNPDRLQHVCFASFDPATGLVTGERRCFGNLPEVFYERWNDNSGGEWSGFPPFRRANPGLVQPLK